MPGKKKRVHTKPRSDKLPKEEFKRRRDEQQRKFREANRELCRKRSRESQRKRRLANRLAVGLPPEGNKNPIKFPRTLGTIEQLKAARVRGEITRLQCEARVYRICKNMGIVRRKPLPISFISVAQLNARYEASELTYGQWHGQMQRQCKALNIAMPVSQVARLPLAEKKARRALVNNLYSGVRRALQRTKSVRCFKTMALIGCSIEHLKDHLEDQFVEGMSWENMGKWHIDHIIPSSRFDLFDPIQQKLCFNWTNLQPLWAVENLQKRDKLNWKRVPLLPKQDHASC